MRLQLLGMAAVAILAASSVFHNVYGEQPKAQADLGKALVKLDAWLEKTPAAKGWSNYLSLSPLEAEVAKGRDADRAVLAESLKQFDSKQPGLQQPQFIQVRQALAAWLNELAVPTAAELPKALENAKKDFTAPAANAQAQAAAVLRAALTPLDRYLGSNRPNGLAWKKYLRWDELQQQLKSPEPDSEVLGEIEARLIANKPGLELKVFADAGDALRKYVDVVEVAETEDLQQEYQLAIDELAKNLDAYAKDPNEQTAAEIGDRIGWLRMFRGSQGVVKGIRRELSHPNLFARMSKPLIAAGIERPVNEITPIRDNIMGTSIHGSGRTIGKIYLELVPNDKYGLFDTMMRGSTSTSTVGYNGPATIWSQGITQTAGRKRVIVDANGIRSYPTTAAATTRNNITGVAAGRGGIVQNIAQKRVAEGKGQAEREAARHAEDRVKGRVESEVNAALAKANSRYQEKFRLPLLRRREFLELLQFATTNDSLEVKAMKANASQVGAPSKPKAKMPAGDLTALAHESMVNNVGAAVYAGLTLTREEVERDRAKRKDKLPEEFQDLPQDENERDWAMTLSSTRPISLSLKDNGFQVTVRIDHYVSDEREFNNSMRVTADYKMTIHEKRPRLIRQGDLVVEPLESGQRQSTKTIALKTILRKKFDRFLLPQITFQPLKLEGEWAKLGPLDMVELGADQGWLTVAWAIQPTKPAAPAKPVAAR